MSIITLNVNGLNIPNRQNRLYNNGYNRRQRRAFYNDKGSIQEQAIMFNIYASKTGAPQHVRQIQTTIKGEIDYNTIIVGDFNTLLSSMDRWSGQKSTSVDIYRALKQKTTHSS